MNRVDLGGVTVLALTDAAPPPADWTYAFPAHAAAADSPARRRWAPDRRFHTRFTVHAVVRAGRVTLVDAGLGPGPSAYFGGLSGRLDRALAEAGLTPDMVDCVMFTHFHLDHVGWASRDGAPCFPRARYVAPSAELAHWQRHGTQSALSHHVAAFEQHIAPLVGQGLLDALPDGQVAPSAAGLTFRSLPGHTPGHAAVVLDAPGAAVAIAGDTWHSPAQVEHPDWCHRADREPHAPSDPARASRSGRGMRARWWRPAIFPKASASAMSSRGMMAGLPGARWAETIAC